MDASHPETAAAAVAASSEELPTPRPFELSQARIFAEAARRAGAPWDSLPEGDDRALRCLLWQRAALFALAAFAGDVSELAPGEALRRAPRALVERAAGGSEWLPSLERALTLDTSRGADASDNLDGQIEVLSRFVVRLLRELELRPRRKQIERLVKIAKVAVALLAVVTAFAVAKRLSATDLARNAKFTTSSSQYDCTGGTCGDAFFHTNEEDSPWIEYDLGQPRAVHRVEIRNRWDCCYDRAVPLVVETSLDRKEWKLGARADEAFMSWTAEFTARARYVRLRVDRRSNLHLKRVRIF